MVRSFSLAMSLQKIYYIKEDIGYKTIYMGWNKHNSEVAIVKNFKEFVIKKYK